MKNPIIDNRLVSDMTFAIRFRDFIKDVDVNDAISEEEKEYLLMVAEELIDWQLHTSSQASDEEKQYLDNVKDIIENKKKCDAISNGHEYVDLGLPSGTLWATCNVGAKDAEDIGLYFSWGSCAGYKESDVGNGDGKKQFCWSDYEERLNINDTAYYHMGGNWRMPTKEDFDELIQNTEYSFDELNGMAKFTSKNGNSVFFPAAGRCHDGRLHVVGELGFYWSRSIFGITSAWGFEFGSFYKETTNGNREYGRCVRGVIKPTKK